MPKLQWNNVGERFYEAGVDRGVIYPLSGTGVAWNGLINVSEKPKGGEVTPYYLDGVKYLNTSSPEEFEGTIEAFTYPDAFAECDGTTLIGGLSAYQQQRKPFGLTYRTMIGNDLEGLDYGYKIHVVYNALTLPIDKSYSSTGGLPEASTFSWDFVTTPYRHSKGLLPLSHISMDSNKTPEDKMQLIEDYLYGTENMSPRLLSLETVYDLYSNSVTGLTIYTNTTTGMNTLGLPESGNGDLQGGLTSGIYTTTTGTRLVMSSTPGISTLQ